MCKKVDDIFVVIDKENVGYAVTARRRVFGTRPLRSYRLRSSTD